MISNLQELSHCQERLDYLKEHPSDYLSVLRIIHSEDNDFGKKHKIAIESFFKEFIVSN